MDLVQFGVILVAAVVLAVLLDQLVLKRLEKRGQRAADEATAAAVDEPALAFATMDAAEVLSFDDGVLIADAEVATQDLFGFDLPERTGEAAVVEPAVTTAAVAGWWTRLTLEHVLMAAIGVLAVSVRLWRLDAAPLQLHEVGNALAAYGLAMGRTELVLGQPSSALLLSLNTFTFWLMGSSDGLARLWPALAGSVVALGPLFFRRQLGRPVALVFAALLAVSPLMVAASRTADGVMLSWLALLLLAVSGLAYRRRGEAWLLVAAAVAFGLGWASGPAFFSGLIVLAVLSRTGVLEQMRGDVLANEDKYSLLAGVWSRLPGLLLAAGIALVLGSSLLLVYQPGLAAVGQGLSDWLQGWVMGAGRVPWMALTLTALYEPVSLVALAIGVALVALDVGQARRLAIAAGVGLVLSTLYAGRTPADALWLSVPLMGLLAATLVWVLGGRWSAQEGWVVTGQAAVLVMVLLFCWISLAGYASGATLREIPLRLGNVTLTFNQMHLALLALAVGGVIVLLFALGWPAEVALRAVTVSVAGVLLVGQVGAMWGLSQLRAADARELWNPAVVIPEESRMLAGALAALSERTVGKPYDMDVTVVGREDVALRWQLRQFHAATVVESLGAGVISSAVVADTASVENPSLGMTYLGRQVPVLEERSAIPAGVGLVKYVLYREGPAGFDHRVLWVREDVHIPDEVGWR